GVVTIDELVEYVGKVMVEMIQKHAKTEEEKKEFPAILGARLNHFTLTENPAVMPKVRARLAKLAQLKKDNKITAEIAEEGQNLLSRMPKLEAQRNLRKEYQKLADGGLEVKEFLDNRTNLVGGMKLQRDVAKEYAERVMKAIDEVGRKYVKEVSAGEL